jgi:HlyD family secretion protein
VRIEQWGGDAPLQGRVRRIEPSGFTKISALGVEEQRVNTLIDFEGPPEARQAIGDGYRVEVRIIVWSRDNVLKVPTSSLFRHGTDWAVFLVEADRAVRRIVRIGERNGLEAEVTSGLSGGERIIVYPSDSVTEGVKVVSR